MPKYIRCVGNVRNKINKTQFLFYYIYNFHNSYLAFFGILVTFVFQYILYIHVLWISFSTTLLRAPLRRAFTTSSTSRLYDDLYEHLDKRILALRSASACGCCAPASVGRLLQFSDVFATMFVKGVRQSGLFLSVRLK